MAKMLAWLRNESWQMILISLLMSGLLAFVSCSGGGSYEREAIENDGFCSGELCCGECGTAPDSKPSPACTDGTAFNTCTGSGIEYCTDSGQLVQDCVRCPHCPSGQACNAGTRRCETPAPAYTEAHYVTQTGAGSRNGSSYANAWSVAQFNDPALWSSQRAADRLIGPGDVVYFSGRLTSSLSVPGSGSARYPVTLDGYEANDTVVTSGASTAGFAHWDGAGMPIRIDGRSHIIVRDFRVTAWTNAAAIYTNGATDVQIINNHLHDGHPTEGKRGIWLSGNWSGDPSLRVDTERVIIAGNLIDGIDDNGSVGSGIVTRPATDLVIRNNVFSRCIDSITLVPGRNVLIEDNSFLGKFPATRSEDHIDIKEGGSENVVIRRNKFHDQEMWGPSGVHPQRTARQIYIYANYFYGQGIAVWIYGGAQMPSGDGIWPTPTENIHVWSNVFSRGRSAIRYADSSYGRVDNILSYNNTINDFTGSAQSSTFTAWHPYSGRSTARNNVFLNNYSNNGAAWHTHIRASQVANTTSADNLAHNSDTTARAVWNDSIVDFNAHGTNNVIANPALDTELRPTLGSTNVIDRAVVISDASLPNYANRFSINGETFCNNIGGTCDNFLSYSIGLHTDTDWTVDPPRAVTADQNSHGSGWERGAYVYSP